MEQNNVTSGNPPEVGTTSGGVSLAEAMAAVLKAHRPLEGLARAQGEAIARRDALWQIFPPLCELPQTAERSLVERQLLKAEEAYLAWAQTRIPAEVCKANVRQAEQDLFSSQNALKEAIAAAESNAADRDDKTLAAAKYMMSMLQTRRKLTVEEPLELQPLTELTGDDEVELVKLRNAAVDFILTEVDIAARDGVLQDLAWEVARGARLGDVPKPVRPLEEEIIRFLSSLENSLQSEQERSRKARPLLKERLALLAKYEGWAKAWQDALNQAGQRPALNVYHNALTQIVQQVCRFSAKDDFQGHHYYDTGIASNPDQLVTHDRPVSTAVEKDQIAYLRKQMRLVAVNMAHRIEAAYALKHTDNSETKVSPWGVRATENWQGCLAWYEELRAKRQAAYIDNLRRSTKIDLLKQSVEHFQGQETEEMTALYKTFRAMIPHNGPLPSNELRKLLDMADFMCAPLHKSND